jgi:Tol biopolymer transport system component
MPQFSPDGNMIYFLPNKGVDGVNQVWSLNITNMEMNPVTFNDRGVTTFDISSDGKYLVFSKYSDIFVLNLESNLINQLRQGWNPSFSPDSKKIIYVSFTDMAGALMDSIDMIDIDNTNYTEIQGWFRFPVSNPKFDRDSQQIIYKIEKGNYIMTIDNKSVKPTHSVIRRQGVINKTITFYINDSDNISYFDLGFKDDELILVEKGNLIIVNMETNTKKTLLDLDNDIDFFDICLFNKKIVLSINGDLWIGDIKDNKT